MRTHRRAARLVALVSGGRFRPLPDRLVCPEPGTLYRRPGRGDDGVMKRSLFVVFVTAGLGAAPSPLAHAAEGAAAAPKPAEKSKAKKPAAAGAKAAPAGEVTLKGQLTCAKCGLHESSVCQNVLLVPAPGNPADNRSDNKPDKKAETKYYLTKNDVAEAHHEEVCGNQVNATVTGRVTDESGKKILTASAITLN